MSVGMLSLHKTHKFRRGNPPVAAAGNPIPLKLAAVEPLGNRSRRNIAYLGDLSGRQDFLAFCHIFTHCELPPTSITILNFHRHATSRMRGIAGTAVIRNF